MYSEATTTDILSLQVKYEQVCLKEKEASCRNSSFRRDIARVRRKMADSSFEMKAKRLQLLKKQYQDLAYSTWLAESALKTSPNINSTHSEPFGKPPKYPTPASTTSAFSVSHPMLTLGNFKPAVSQLHGFSAFSITDHPSLHQPLLVSSELPPHHMSHTAQAVSAHLTASASASSHLHYSTITSPISHPVPFGQASSVPKKEMTSIPFSCSLSYTPTLSASTSQEVEDRISPFQTQVAVRSESSNSSKLSISNLPSLQALPASFPSTSSMNIINLPEREPEEQTPSISPLSMSNSSSIGSSKCSDLKDELLQKSPTSVVKNKKEIEGIEGTDATGENTFDVDLTIPVQRQSEPNEVAKEDKGEWSDEKGEWSVEEELNQEVEEGIEVPNKIPHIEVPLYKEKELVGSDRREAESEVEDVRTDVQEELKEKQQTIETISKQHSLDIEEEKGGDENSVQSDGHEESIGNLQSDANKDSFVASTSSLLEQSHTESLQDQPLIPTTGSPSQHMSAYYKMVGQFTAQNASSIPSLSSDGSDLEDDLRLAVSKTPDNDDPKSLDNEDAEEEEDLLSLPDNTIPPPNLVGQLSGQTLSTKSSGSPALVQESRKPLVDSTSLKRRMGLISSSEDDSSERSFKPGVSVQHKSPVHGGNIELLDDQEDDDDDFDFYS